MKKISLIIFSLFLVGLSFSQAPASFKYQAVVRYQDGAIVQNQTVALRISILSESPVGNTVYIEAHNVATNEFGIANLNIGEGNPVDGNFTDIDWGSNTYFIKSELDLNNGSAYEFIGTSQLLSVPYALYAANAVNVDDADADPTNEIQILAIEGNELSISEGNSVMLPEDFDLDFDPTNEIQVLSFYNDTLYLENGGWAYLGEYTDNTDEQVLFLDGTTLSISNGNSVTFNEAVDMDGDPTNELQFLSISNDTIYLSQGNYVKLPEAFDWQYSSLIGAPVDVSHFNNDAGYITNPADADADPSNEIQIISISNDTIFLSSGGFVRLPTGNNPGDMRYWDGNEWVLIPIGEENYTLIVKNGYPQWQPFYSVGSIGPAGGFVFYDKGYYSDGWRYLEAAPKATEWTDTYWGCVNQEISGAEGILIGTGKQNTIDILNGCGENNFAAKLCDELVYNGYDDWFLPSKNELLEFVTNIINNGSDILGEGVEYGGYWCSSEIDIHNAYQFSTFELPYQFVSAGKGNDIFVRAIRAF